jgi:hypothetical protein
MPLFQGNQKENPVHDPMLEMVEELADGNLGKVELQNFRLKDVQAVGPGILSLKPVEQRQFVMTALLWLDQESKRNYLINSSKERELNNCPKITQ